jgi:putative ATPase
MSNAPLADRMRPRTLDEIVGQERWIGPEGALRVPLQRGKLRSLVLYGPPGCGKTTLARALAAEAKMPFIALSAVLDGVKELRGAVERAEIDHRLSGRSTLVFVDEIHRWSKSQQDALLPHVESGLVVLVGATTENPAFELNKALRSRLQVVTLTPIATDRLTALLRQAMTDPRGLSDRDVRVDDEVIASIARGAAGDARRALDDLERIVEASPDGATVDLERAQRLLQRQDIRHDRDGDDHFDCLSALIKSMRGSDPDAAVYWLARLLAGGEDPVVIARRILIFAAEDVGNADPRGLLVADAAARAADRVGMPEVRIVLSQAVLWLACAPKSNAAYLAIDRAMAAVADRGALPVPANIKSKPDGYVYPHDAPFRIVAQPYMPAEIAGMRFYEPTVYGDEKVIGERLAWWRKKLEG